jgi:hypothetical protein
MKMSEIAVLINLCDRASKAIKQYGKKKLSNEEKKLLISALPTGVFYILSVDQIPGYWIRIGDKDFQNEKDPAYAAKFREAFESLCERGYITHENGRLFMLSGSGFAKAEKLAKKY